MAAGESGQDHDQLQLLVQHPGERARPDKR
jgi:hypothetical protein